MNTKAFIESFFGFWSWEYRLYWADGKRYQITIELYDFVLEGKTLFYTAKYNHESGSLHDLSQLKNDYRPNLNHLSQLILKNFDIDYVVYQVLNLDNKDCGKYHFQKVNGVVGMKTNFI